MANSKIIEARLEQIKTRLTAHAKKAEERLHEIKTKIAEIDSASGQAKARFAKLKKTGLGEIHRLRTVLESEVGRLSRELHKSSEKLKAQFKTITQAERMKRRGRGRSRGA